MHCQRYFITSFNDLELDFKTCLSTFFCSKISKLQRYLNKKIPKYFRSIFSILHTGTCKYFSFAHAQTVLCPVLMATCVECVLSIWKCVWSLIKWIVVSTRSFACVPTGYQWIELLVVCDWTLFRFCWEQQKRVVLALQRGLEFQDQTFFAP